MKKPSERIAQQFRCPKCMGRESVSREVTLGSVAERLAPGGSPGRYLLVSCVLCGFTETYHLKIIETVEAAEKTEAKAKVRETGG